MCVAASWELLSEVLNRCLRANPPKDGVAELRGYGEVIASLCRPSRQRICCWRLFISSPPPASSIITSLLVGTSTCPLEDV